MALSPSSRSAPAAPSSDHAQRVRSRRCLRHHLRQRASAVGTGGGQPGRRCGLQRLIGVDGLGRWFRDRSYSLARLDTCRREDVPLPTPENVPSQERGSRLGEAATTSASAAERAPGSEHSHAVAPDTLTCRDAGRAPPLEKLERPLSITVTARTAITRSRLARARQPQVKGQTRRRLLERKLVGPNPVAMEGVGQTRPARAPPGTAC